MMTDISESFSKNDGCYYGVCVFLSCLCCCSRMKHDSRADVLVMRSLGKMPAYAWKLVRVCCAALISMHDLPHLLSFFFTSVGGSSWKWHGS